MVDKSQVGADVKACSPGLYSLPPLCVRKCQSPWVWIILGVVSGWVCPGQEWKVLGESGPAAVRAAGTARSSQASQRSRSPRFP